MNPSKKFRLNLRDITRGLVMAALTPVVFLVQQSIDAGSLDMEPKKLGFAAVAGAVAYLIKNYFTGKKEDTNKNPYNNE